MKSTPAKLPKAEGMLSGFVVALFILGLSSGAGAAVVLPSWFGAPNTTSQVFLFNTASTSPTPNSSVNPYGTTSASVDVGLFGNGWEDPASLPLSNPGHDGDGAWDIGAGTDGSITFEVPVAPGSPGAGLSYRLDIMIYAVAYRDLQQLPLPSVLGLAPGDLVLTSNNVLSSRLPAGTWRELTWQAQKQDHMTGAITVALTPPNGAVSVIDRVEIYTRFTVVPEPSSFLLSLVAGLVFCCRRRRS